ncbi:uncharacterized protein MELLADRAFT_94273 [Melampsora larici-populina 98AG31]|uniref:Uncharacterized protein n=1 Tax=Melampsora larici-populina (strain 98AG31 / pathotype 3-4-7) TaxID=747676 RepID=F4S744_MELLP|nr:uncharacterized protein MELLADRAFT_94273 [Melampsora larici-populina 98AG31]EGF99574.1 hypothetical protein MELLADRAFT_94273 [Melampsora larici-populina 98AG31]
MRFDAEMQSKVKIAEDRLEVASKTLQRLQARDESYTLEYFSSQWERQKRCQITAMADDAAETQERMEQCLLELLELQEEVKHAHEELNRLRRKRRRNRTDEDIAATLTLPASIVALETAILDVTEELGSEEFRRLHQATSPKALALIGVRLAKMKLYEAKVGIVEAQKKWDKEVEGDEETYEQETNDV